MHKRDKIHQVLVSFGSNVGDKVKTCREAISLLGCHSKVGVIRVSSFYMTEPVGLPNQEWFINGVVECETKLDPLEFLKFTSDLEAKFGRVRTQRWGPRTLDLDILAYDQEVIHLHNLTIPHPRLHERRFVLIPLVEIKPRWRHPVFGVTAEELLRTLSDQGQRVEFWSYK